MAVSARVVHDKSKTQKHPEIDENSQTRSQPQKRNYPVYLFLSFTRVQNAVKDQRRQKDANFPMKSRDRGLGRSG